MVELTSKQYKKELQRLQTELVYMQEWIVAHSRKLIVLAATAGKLGGTFVAARLTGLDWRTSASLGMLMNTRGLMELIVLNIGLDLRVISPTLFAMMVLMALATTLASTPILQLLTPRIAQPDPRGRVRHAEGTNVS